MLPLPPYANARRTVLAAQLDFLERQVTREMEEKKAAAVPAAGRPPAHWATRLVHSRALVVLSSPVIWSCIVPLVLLDLIGTAYQAICFPVYGIPKVRRRDYLAFDRHLLGYLSTADKFNCEYCAYANGTMAYFTEIAARTEQYWCPIKHERAVAATHRRYGAFLDYGDAVQYRRRLEEVRHAFDDAGGAAARTHAETPPPSAPAATREFPPANPAF